MKIGIYEECRNCTKDDRRYGFIPYAAVCHSRRQALFPIQKTAWKAGESELICLHGGSRLGRLAGDIESGRGDIKDKKRQSSYAVKSSIHAVGVKNILIFPIHEVRKEGGGGNQNSGL